MFFSIAVVAIIIVFVSGCEGCLQEEQLVIEDIKNEQGLVNTELFLYNDTVTYFWKVREVPGRQSLRVHEGVLGEPSSSYELYEDEKSKLENLALKLAREKYDEGYRIYDADDYNHIIIQIDAAHWGDINDIEQFFFVEEVINDALTSTGNGKCSGSDISNKISYFAVVFDSEIAVKTILDAFEKNDFTFPVVIAKEKVNDIKIIHPENFHGEFSLP